MITITIIFLVLPFFLGFSLVLLPKIDRYLALLSTILGIGYAFSLFVYNTPLTINLIDNFGVTLLVDQLSAYFILTNGIVSTAVILYCWNTDKTAFFYAQTLMLYGSVNATFISADFINLYVALEVISIAAFLVITYPRSDRSIWVGLRYLLVSNTAMLFYLVGAILVYKANNSFYFGGLQNSPPEAIALIIMGLLVKGGIFISGLWLPLTHSESQSQVSAMLSGVVVKAGVFPLVRCALMLEEIDPIVRMFGVGTALLGVGYAVFEKDTKRMLAFHTISQLGFILAAPIVGGFYALTHGLVKSALFLIAGILPSRNFKELQHQPIPNSIWIALVIASFSISGFPLLSGFGAKVLTTKNLLPWQVIGMNIAALGTAISFAKFIFLPHEKQLPYPDKTFKFDDQTGKLPQVEKKIQPGFWWAMGILLGGLIAANVVYYEAYTIKNIVKPLVTIFMGWSAYLFIFKHTAVKFPRGIEQFDHQIGLMTLMTVLLFWIVIP